MLRFTAIVSVFAANFAWAEPDEVELNVKPSLCIVDQRTPSCEMDLVLDWTAANKGDYCLDEDATELKCWAQRASGNHEQSRTVHATIAFTMRDLSDNEQCASASVEVLRMDNEDRRRNRRSRHVWDLL